MDEIGSWEPERGEEGSLGGGQTRGSIHLLSKWGLAQQRGLSLTGKTRGPCGGWLWEMSTREERRGERCGDPDFCDARGARRGSGRVTSAVTMGLREGSCCLRAHLLVGRDRQLHQDTGGDRAVGTQGHEEK